MSGATPRWHGAVVEQALTDLSVLDGVQVSATVREPAPDGAGWVTRRELVVPESGVLALVERLSRAVLPRRYAYLRRGDVMLVVFSGAVAWVDRSVPESLARAMTFGIRHGMRPEQIRLDRLLAAPGATPPG